MSKESDLLNALRYQERMASQRGNLDDDRRDALDRYFGRPYGDEAEGRSQVVMRDVADTVEWIKPSLLKIFAAGDRVVSFSPVGPEDEKQAEQETDYCNHVLMQRNNGFLVLHDWFHDALTQRNGYVMVSATTKKKHNRETFRGLSDDEFAMLMQSEGIELDEHAQSVQEMNTPAGPVQVLTHDAVVRQVSEYACIEVHNIPPERVLVANDWPHVSLTDCPFVEVIQYRTVSELRELGYDVDDQISDQDETEYRDYAEEIRGVTDEGYFNRDDDQADPLTRRLRVRHAWIRFDKDGDGIAELRRLVVVGNTILEDDEDDLIPVASLTPGRLPHEHVGQSVDDWVQDLQRIRTVLMRGYLDGVYLQLYGRTAVDETRVNLDDLLNPRPGGIVRTQGSPGDVMMPMVQPHAGGEILQAVEMIDTIRENRTGVTKYNQGLDANSLNKTAAGISQIMTASQQRIELIARVFAETGVRELMLIIHAISIKNGRQPEMMKLRNEWVPVDPRAWKTRQDVTVSVGIGTGSKDQQLGHLMMILGEQKQALAVGIATPVNVYNTLKRLTQNAGFRNADEFWTNPASQPPQPPQPNPEVMKAQMDMQVKQADLQIRAQSAQADLAVKQQAAQIDLEKARVELQIKMADLDLRRQALELKAQEAELDARVSMQNAAMHASDDMARARAQS